MPTPAEETAFFTPIRARPRDDLPRLLYADYLDESTERADQDRAEFIRLQLALARIPHDHPDRAKLAERQNELLLLWYDDWTRPLRGLADGFEFHRGLIDSVTVRVQTFATKGEELFRLAPIQRVRFVDAGRMIGKLVNLPLLAQVREIVICSGEFGDGGLNVLLRSPYLHQVQSLDLSFCGLSDGGVRLLASLATLPRLRRLFLNDNQRITSVGISSLACSSRLSRLQELDISANGIDGTGIERLANSTAVFRLHTLRLRANRIGDDGCLALARSALLKRMLARDTRLELRHNSIGTDGVVALAASPLFSAVTSLDLSDNPLKDGAAYALAESTETQHLVSLTLRSCGISDSGAIALARSPLMRRLSSIDLSSNKMTRRGIDELWKHRRDWNTVIQCDGNLPGVFGPSANVLAGYNPRRT
jgi:uncharacterized protein (TIGR02996 family)